MKAVAALEHHVRSLEDSGASRSLARQRRWALAGAVTAAALAEMHGPSPTTAQIAGTDPRALDAARALVELSAVLDPDFTTWYLPWASDGPLAGTPGKATSVAAARARASALRALAREHAAPAPDHTHAEPRPRATLPPRAADDVLTVIGDALRPGPGATRIAALIAVCAAAPARAGLMVAMHLDDVEVIDEGHAMLHRPPDGGPAVPLTGPRAHALASWLPVRADLVARLGGSAPPALWVAVRPHMTPEGAVRPAGLPLHARGMERAYAAAVTRLNLYLANNPERIPHHLNPAVVGPVLPLPTSFELMRRSLSRSQGHAAPS